MRILLAEHHTKVLRALRRLISARSELAIAGEATDWDALVRQAKISKPDLVLLAWGLPGRADDTPFAELRTDDCYPKIIVLSTQSDVKEEALAAGADAFVSKGDSPEKLLEALGSSP